jgi:hypothetical protein
MFQEIVLSSKALIASSKATGDLGWNAVSRMTSSLVSFEIFFQPKRLLFAAFSVASKRAQMLSKAMAAKGSQFQIPKGTDYDLGLHT